MAAQANETVSELFFLVDVVVLGNGLAELSLASEEKVNRR